MLRGVRIINCFFCQRLSMQTPTLQDRLIQKNKFMLLLK
ncbi:hypothetical protein MYAER_2536 [Microcystis aeruginosa NIES-2549]|uniref:Uncharacterized protein n=1 Tax=Microcystis aeruginosa NIES-2549 TaxID=1641812 RepID=A0A0F6RLQ1_MICAE|nr:hypothetical protein MYAER_2536 [Microcystis aeruginosa NIES-2549]AOC53279.1 hypothetical protein amyaer_2568 [Microcystis aeruginosa NIES-2481]